MSKHERTRSHPAGTIRASLVSAACFLRGVPLFFSQAPRTPLRVLGIIALDTLHVLRHSRPMPRQRIHELALFLDIEGCANRAWDNKQLCAASYRTLRQRLERAGLGACLEAYLDRLRKLEGRRPSIGGGHRRADAVRSYREAVARLSITTAAALALNDDCRAEHVHAARDADVDALFRILMQCQIIDDVVDYAEDLAAGLPSFLTASASLSQAMASTADAARSYAADGGPSPTSTVFPLRITLRIVSAVTMLVVRAADLRHRHAQQFAQQTKTAGHVTGVKIGR
jgi:hypothetical protein